MYCEYTANTGSCRSHFLTAGFLVYCASEVSKVGDIWTTLEVTMHFKYTAHISSTGSHFLKAGFLCPEHRK